MSNELLKAFNAAEVDPSIGSTSFGVQTKWHVLTGAPCSGKTTLLKMLAEQGFPVVHESARIYIEQEMAKGRTLEEIYKRKDDERAIINLQLNNEHGLPTDEPVFLDRGIPDAIAFHRLKDLDPNEVVPDCCHYRYASVFMIDRLPLEVDWARLDNDPLVDFFDYWHERDYAALGYDVIRVPVLPPKERLAFVLRTLSERKHL